MKKIDIIKFREQKFFKIFDDISIMNDYELLSIDTKLSLLLDMYSADGN